MTEVFRIGVKQVFYVGQFVAWVGADRFLRLIPDAAYFSVGVYLQNKLIQALIAEITALQSVA